MKCFFFLFSSFALFFSNVASLSITVSPEAIANSPTLVFWARSDADPDDFFHFDLRIVQNNADVGLAAAGLAIEADADFGNTTVTFPSTGTFTLKAVTGNTVIGTSSQVQIIAAISTSTSAAVSTSISAATSAVGPQSSAAMPPSAVLTSASTTVAVPTTTSASVSGSSSASTSFSSSAPSSSSTSTVTPNPMQRLIRHPNLPALVGGIIGSLAGLALLVVLGIFLHRRRTTLRRRLTFHRDMMVQRRLSRAPTLPPLDPRTSCADFAHDVEQGLPESDPAAGGSNEDAENASTETLVGPRLGTGHIVPSPRGPRPAAKRIATITTHRSTGSPLSSPRLAAIARSASSPAPQVRTKRQQELADRAAMLRRQMADLQLELDRISLRSATTTAPSMSLPVASPVTVASPMTMTSSGMSAPNGRAAEIRAVLDDMQRQMVWLREQESAPWAMHQTDVLPPGHERYLRP